MWKAIMVQQNEKYRPLYHLTSSISILCFHSTLRRIPSNNDAGIIAHEAPHNPSTIKLVCGITLLRSIQEIIDPNASTERQSTLWRRSNAVYFKGDKIDVHKWRSTNRERESVCERDLFINRRTQQKLIAVAVFWLYKVKSLR